MSAGFGSTGLDGLVEAGADILMNTIGNALFSLVGLDDFRLIFNQDETGSSGVKQYIDEPTDRGKWAGTVDKSRPDYYFLLKGPVTMKAFGIGGTVQRSIQIPFNVSPQREAISEPVASTITYTQGGGRIRESEGMISKDITISGVTGLYPKGNPNKSSGIGSGLEQLKFLETCFRRYAFMSRYGDIKKNIQLIYVSRRRQEAWVVEPKNFTSEDATEHNFNWHYTIQLEALYPYDGSDAKGLAEQLLSSIPGYKQYSNVLQIFGESVDQLNAAASQITALSSGFVNTLLNPIIGVANAYADFRNNKIPNLQSIKRDTLRGVSSNLIALETVAAASKNRDVEAKARVVRRDITRIILDDKAFELPPSDKGVNINRVQAAQTSNYKDLKGNPIASTEALKAGAVAAPPSASSQFTTGNKAPTAVTGSATKANIVSASVTKGITSNPSSPGSASLETSTLPAGTYSITRSQKVALNADSLLPAGTYDLLTQANWQSTYADSLRAVDAANADFRTAIIAVGDSIQTLAAKLLGDAARWPELVILNNYRYPYVAAKSYITANNLKRVGAWGDTILYPVPKSNTSVAPKRVWRKETSESVALDPLQRALGCDIKIDSTTRDIVFTSNDIGIAYGVDNIDQFIRKRVLLKKGLLRRAISLGFTSIIGQREVQEEMIRAEARGLFKDDDRIASCQVIDIRFLADVIVLTLAVYVKDIQDPIIISEKMSA